MSKDSHAQLLAPQGMHKPVGYSHLARINDGKVVFIAGQVALDSAGNVVGKDDFAAQTKQVFENLKTAVEAAGGGLADIIKLNVYLVSATNLPQYREIRDRYLDLSSPPASTAIQVAALFRPEFLIEIEAVAVVP
jgi:enamine deaminase RidA (YjgF/YER057c/UK114 family)